MFDRYIVLIRDSHESAWFVVGHTNYQLLVINIVKT